MHRTRLAVVLALAASVALAAPAAASAQFPVSTTNPGTVTMTAIAGVAYTARPGQENDVTVSVGRDAIAVRDEAALLTAGTGCRPGGDLHEVVCGRDTAGVTAWSSGQYTMSLGDRDDVVHVVDDSLSMTDGYGYGFSLTSTGRRSSSRSSPAGPPDR